MLKSHGHPSVSVDSSCANSSSPSRASANYRSYTVYGCGLRGLTILSISYAGNCVRYYGFSSEQNKLNSFSHWSSHSGVSDKNELIPDSGL